MSHHQPVDHYVWFYYMQFLIKHQTDINVRLCNFYLLHFFFNTTTWAILILKYLQKEWKKCGLESIAWKASIKLTAALKCLESYQHGPFWTTKNLDFDYRYSYRYSWSQGTRATSSVCIVLSCGWEEAFDCLVNCCKFVSFSKMLVLLTIFDDNFLGF